jgi:non-lysosomal glucosylceramidase
MPRKCNCAGTCVPQGAPENTAGEVETTVSRRDFIALAGIGVTGAMLTGAAGEAETRRREAQKAADLADWKRALPAPSAPRRYRSQTHTDARMPLGGIGTGNFEIGVDGQITTWQLFNTLRDGFVPFVFGVKVGKTAKMLQTAGGPDGIPRVQSIEMTGEYPCATLRFQDSDLPVHVEMTAFTPFAPLDTEFSALPVACFVFKVHNPTDREQTVSLGAFLQNAVGYDALGAPLRFASTGASVAHPNFGGNINEVVSLKDATLLAMRAESAGAMTSDLPLNLYTNLPAGAFNTPYEGRPASLSVEGLDRLPANAGASSTLIWLEDPAADFQATTLKAVVQAVRGGATLVFSGRTMPLLQHYAELTGGKPLDTSKLRPDVVFEDFEKGYENWTVEGTAFGKEPAHGTLPGQQAVSGFLGHGLVNSFLGGDDTVGKLTSKPFRIERGFIRFLIGGGGFPNTQIRLIVDGKTVRATAGHENERLLPAFWDVRNLAGKQAQIAIVDEQKGGWGHINIDQIEFSDLPGSADVLVLLDEILPVRFDGIQPIPTSLDRHGVVEFRNRTLQTGAREERLADGRTVITRPLGAGKVLLTHGPILAPDQVELIGARREAYRSLALIGGIKLTTPSGVPARAPGFGTMTLGVLSKAASHNVGFTDWKTGWDTFASQEKLVSPYGAATGPSPDGQTHNGALAAHLVVPPGKSVEVPFFLTWSYPNKYSGGTWVGNHYSATWPDALATAKDVVQRFPALKARTEKFRSVFYDSSLPYWLLDCVTSQAATLRHVGVVFRIANGDVYGWEGSNGCCDPTCTHVWGYVTNLAHLFPEMERDMRRIDFKHQQNPDGGVNNRTAVPSPPRPTGEHPFTDGHCSTVLKAYREALNSPDESWLKEYWPGIKKAVAYLIQRDAATSNGLPNGLLEDDQWNTYDEALHGVTGFIGVYYLAALRAGEVMADRMGDKPFADHCHSVFLAGQKNLIARCWNGEYLQQNLPGYEKRGGEVGPGCMADQLIGQWWAHQLGLGYLLPQEMVKTALKSVFKYNWMPDLTGWKHSPRAFAGAKDKGLIICTWPKGGRPPNVMLYSDEVWTGIEYQVAGHMLYEGMLEEGFAIVKGTRDRYDGIPKAPIPRSPWNEIECGGHYARAGSSWTLLLALSGWLYDGAAGHLEFRPIHTPENFKSFFSGSDGWGSLAQTRKGGGQRNDIHVEEGTLKVTRLRLDTSAPPKSATVKVAGKTVAAALKAEPDGVFLDLSQPTVIKAGQTLTVTLS